MYIADFLKRKRDFLQQLGKSVSIAGVHFIARPSRYYTSTHTRHWLSDMKKKKTRVCSSVRYAERPVPFMKRKKKKKILNSRKDKKTGASRPCDSPTRFEVDEKKIYTKLVSCLFFILLLIYLSLLFFLPNDHTQSDGKIC